MLTVGNFAILCACGPRTLRYYDRVGLLKPAHVHPWTGYRYYEEDQLRDYQRIRSLQGAGFTIGEIRELLHAPEGELRQALQRKGAELTQTLQRLRELEKDGFPAETMDMEGKIQEAKEAMAGITRKIGPEDLAEVGLGPDMLERLRAKLLDYWEGFFRGVTGLTVQETQKEEFTGWERSGWETAAEALAELPELEDGGAYRLCVTLKERPRPVTEHFLNVVIGAVLLRNEGKQLRLGVEPDGATMGWGEENRLRLMRLR